MTWFSPAESVTHTVTVQQSNDIYRALDAYASRFQDGPTRARLDRLVAQISRENQAAAGFIEVDSTAVEVPPTPPNDEPLGFAFNRALAALHEDIDEGDEAA